MGDIRIGKVSSVDYDNGMVQVLYTDRDGAITKALPVLTFNDEYKMPQVGSYVLVAHLSNGTEAGYILGSYWNEAHAPASSGKGVYRKEYGSKQGAAYTKYEDENATLEIHGDNILLTGAAIDIIGDAASFVCAAGEITAAQIIEKFADHEKRLKEVESKV